MKITQYPYLLHYVKEQTEEICKIAINRLAPDELAFLTFNLLD